MIIISREPPLKNHYIARTADGPMGERTCDYIPPYVGITQTHTDTHISLMLVWDLVT